MGGARAACISRLRPISFTEVNDVKLKENQLRLLRHLAQFETLDYLSCLRMLDAEKTNNRTALSYVFRPLTKNKYVRRRKDGSVVILTKGRTLFPNIKPLVTLGGGAAVMERVNTVSKVAMYMWEAGIESAASPNETEDACFVPSACWRRIRDGILSTTRFAGMLFIGSHRLVVYDIGNGNIEWQSRAESSLFYQKYGSYETRASGMLLICNDDKRVEIAQCIIRQTMWQRRQLLAQGSGYERDRPVKYVRSPIRLKAEYLHAYLTTPKLLSLDLKEIAREADFIKKCRRDKNKTSGPTQGDYEDWPYRRFVNIATDLLKYVYFFAAVKKLIAANTVPISEMNYSIALPKQDFPIIRMYPDVIEKEGLVFYEYISPENRKAD